MRLPAFPPPGARKPLPLAEPPGGTSVTVALVLVLVGALAKSAQFPFHFWLPGAMAAPTPISAYLHSATMVKAGVYLIARFSPVFADVGPWTPLVVGAGLATLVVGAWRHLAAVAGTSSRSSDPGVLASLTYVPRVVWNLSFAIVCAAASWIVATEVLPVLQ